MVKSHPVYVVRVGEWHDEGCGHQHQYPQAAINCATNIMTRRRALHSARVLRIRLLAKSETIRETIVATLERPTLASDLTITV